MSMIFLSETAEVLVYNNGTHGGQETSEKPVIYPLDGIAANELS